MPEILKPTVSGVLRELASDPRMSNRGLRLVGETLKTRDPATQGKEWFQIGRLWAQNDAVKLIEKAIDESLGGGEGRKLLTAMGGVYGVFGNRITKEQAETALTLALAQDQEARIRVQAQSGELIKFSLSPAERQRIEEEIRHHLAHPNQLDPRRFDSAFEVDALRVSITLVEGDKIYNVLSEMEKARLADDPTMKYDFIVGKLKDFLKQEGDTEEVLFKRLLHASTLLNQNIIGTTVLPIVMDKIGGLPSGVKGESRTDFVLDKTRDSNGAVVLKINVFHTKARLDGFVPQGQAVATDLIPNSSTFHLHQFLGIPADGLAMGDPSALTVHSVEVRVQMTKAES